MRSTNLLTYLLTYLLHKYSNYGYTVTQNSHQKTS